GGRVGGAEPLRGAAAGGLREGTRRQVPNGEEAGMRVMGVARFERFFRVAAGLDVDKEDLKRLNDFLGRKARDLLLRGEAMAKANGRDIIEPFDLPITKGLQENTHQFRGVDRDLELEPILDDITPGPPLDLACSDETEAQLAGIAGGLSL